MIIVIEGPDASGKSTLAWHLAQTVDGAYVHASAPERHPLVEYTSTIETLLPEPVILDRWHIGEMIYGPRYRGKAGLSPHQFHAVEDYLAEHGALLVHCDDYYTDLCYRLRQRGEAVHGTYRGEVEAFRSWVRRSSLPTYHYRVSRGATDQQAEKIIGLAKELEHRCTS